MTSRSAIAFPLVTASGETRRRWSFEGIYEPPPISLRSSARSRSARQTFDAAFPRPRNLFTFVHVTGDPARPPRARSSRPLAGFPDAKLHTRVELRDRARTKEFEDDPESLYVLLAFSVVVSLFGMVNTLVLSVFERTRELGMLRAVGMTRQQARRMVRHESVITALIGAALGLPLGVFLSFLVTQALSQYDVSSRCRCAARGLHAAWRRRGSARSDPARPGVPRVSTSSRRSSTSSRRPATGGCMTSSRRHDEGETMTRETPRAEPRIAATLPSCRLPSSRSTRRSTASGPFSRRSRGGRRGTRT